MSHWTAPYIGLEYIPIQRDCAALATTVQAEVFGRDIYDAAERANGLRAQSHQLTMELARLVQPTSDPIEGDLVLMRSRGSLSHIGVFATINGADYVLHAMRNAGQVVLHRIADLWKVGLDIEGYYRWTD